MGVSLYVPPSFFVAFSFFVSALSSGGGTKFDYSQVKKWGTLDPRYAKCSVGKSQSPIDIKDIDAVVNKTSQPLTRKYHVHSASLLADGIEVEVKFNATGALIIDGKKYELKQMHWHTPSEHLLNGIRYDAELHEVHVAEDGSRAVIGVLLKEGHPSPVLTMLKPVLEKIAKKPCEGDVEEVAIPQFDSKFIRKRPRGYYRYLGSLTTPPCDENVIWTLLSKVKSISREQIEALKAPACGPNKKNARPKQPLNGRMVQKHQIN